MKISTFISGIILFLMTNLYANSVSNLQGELSVNSGVLYYSVPLALPAGIANVKPKVSLTYDSNGANSYLGEGWNITGISTISRCGSNFEFDGKRRGIKYDDEDNICLDGKRLVLVSGTKWEANSEYRTKIETYSKIVYDGTDFTVWTKSGDIKKYTLINRNWLLSSISDRFENTINYNYFSNSTEVYLQDITYADNKVQLNYEDKLDKFDGYSAGYNIQLTKRVKSIDVKSGDSVLRTYELKYAEQQNSFDKSILESLTECSGGICLEPLKFENTRSNTSFTGSTSPINVTSNTENIKLSDFNGDGLIDIYEVKEGNDLIWLNEGAGKFTSSLEITGVTSSTENIKLSDFNGDGLIDIYEVKEGNDLVWLNEGAGKFTSSLEITGVTSSTENIKLSDFNGDGLIDIYEVKEGNDLVWLNEGAGKFTSSLEITGVTSSTENIKLSDFNGDGLIDIYEVKEGNDLIWLNEEEGSFTSSSEISEVTSNTENIKLVDLNGDGLIDIQEVKDNDNVLWLNKGDTSFISSSKTYEEYMQNFQTAGITSSTENTRIADFNGDGLIDIYEVKSGNDKVWINNSQHIKLVSITDSFNNRTTIEYKPLTDGSVYHKLTNATYPDMDIQPTLEVVSSVTTTTSNQEEMKTTYKYEGLKVNAKGLGSLGFAKITSINELSKVKSITLLNQNYPYIGLTKNTLTYLDDELISDTSYQYTNSKTNEIYQLQNTNQISKFYESGQLQKSIYVTNSDFDEYGNIKTIVSKTTDETTGEVFTKIANNIYTNNETNWILSRLIKATVTSAAYGDTKTKTSSFTYNATTGILETETIEPSSSKWLKKSHTYDAHGNEIKESVSGADIQTSETTTSYDSLGKFPVKTTNALGHSESREYNKDGQLVKVTSPNGLVTTLEYDKFGKKIKETRADGTTTTYSYSFDSSLPASYYAITVKSDGSSAETTYFNSLSQELRTQIIGFNGKVIYEDTTYDKFGNVVQKSSPYSENETPEYTYITYDKYQRVVKTDSPAPNNQRAVNTNSYNGYSVSSTNAKGQVKTTTKNALGNVIKVEEEENAYQLYSYDAQGHLVKTTDSKGNKIVIDYDIFGNKIYQNDPDLGEWSYTYNSLGQLVSQSDAKGQTTTIQYDLLGRKISENINGVISTWEYDTTKKVNFIKRANQTS